MEIIKKGIKREFTVFSVGESKTDEFILKADESVNYVVTLASTYEVYVEAAEPLDVFYQQRYGAIATRIYKHRAKNKVWWGPKMEGEDKRQVVITIGPAESDLTGKITVTRKD